MLRYAVAMLLSGDRPTVTDRDFVMHNLHSMPLLLLVVFSL